MRAAGLAAAAAALGLLLAGCGGTGGLAKEGSISQGQQLFVGEGQCASCHVLAHAGAQGKVGPDLDAAFRVLQEEEYPDSTIREIVAKQIKYPVTDPPTGKPGMPADLVEGEDVDAVASYVACAAGLDIKDAVDAGCGPAAGGGPDGGAGADDPKSIFTSAGCGSCHVFADAGGTGEVGPSLDESTLDEAAARRQIAEGGGGMPPFGDQLSPEQLDALAKYVVEQRQ